MLIEPSTFFLILEKKVLGVLEIQVLKIHNLLKYFKYSVREYLYLKYQTSTHVLKVLPNSVVKYQ